MNKLTTTFLAGVAALGLAAASAAWASPAAAAAEPPVSAASAPMVAQATAPAALPPAEIAGLTLMREEEKLARDVYLALDDAWDLQVFANIARSEQNHMDAVGTLLTRYGLPDPAAGNAPGEFTNPDLQALYDQLMGQGEQSLGDALRVGAAIEEIDIRDLREQLPAVRHSDIRRVYEQLEQGSENHLRAFVSTLERQTGETVEPHYLDQAVYDEIVGGTSGQGGRGRGRGRPS